MFVPADFVVPLRLETSELWLEPLGPKHNDADYGAWSSSLEHIHATPGWEESSWPRDMTLEENRADLQRHADDFENRSGFTYTVLEPGGDVVGCVYIYPALDGPHEACALVGEGEPRRTRRAPLAGGEGLACSRVAVRGRRLRAKERFVINDLVAQSH